MSIRTLLKLINRHTNKELIDSSMKLYRAIQTHLQTDSITDIFEYVNNAVSDRIKYESQSERQHVCPFCKGSCETINSNGSWNSCKECDGLGIITK